MDSETRRAWRRLQREVKDDAPIVLRGLANSGKHIAQRLYSAAVRRFKSWTKRTKEWGVSLGGRRPLVAQLYRVRLRSPIYKA